MLPLLPSQMEAGGRRKGGGGRRCFSTTNAHFCPFLFFPPLESLVLVVVVVVVNLTVKDLRTFSLHSRYFSAPFLFPSTGFSNKQLNLLAPPPLVL